MASAIVFIVLFAGLFIVISLGIYYRHKTNLAIMSESSSAESFAEIHKAKVLAGITSGRSVALRIGGFFAGFGLGLTLSVAYFTSNFEYLKAIALPDEDPVILFVIFGSIAVTLLCSGLGLIGTYFIERRLERKVKN